MDKVIIKVKNDDYSIQIEGEDFSFNKKGKGNVVVEQEQDCFDLKFRELNMPNLTFDISENGNYIVSFNATINILQKEVVVLNNEAIVSIPDGVYTINSVTFESTSCVKTYSTPIDINCPVLPKCNCDGSYGGNFTLGNIQNVAGNFYSVPFNACNVNPFNWKVLNEAGTVIKEGSVVPTSGVVTINLSGVLNGNYKLIASSTDCQGTAEKVFSINKDVIISPPASESQIEYRFFTTQHVPNQSNLINTLKQAKRSYPNVKLKAPVIFNWRDTVNILSTNGSVSGGINNFSQPLQRLDELLTNNISPFVIIDCNLTSVIGDSPKMGTATYLPEDKIRRRDGGGEVTSISWSSPRMSNVYSYITQSMTALKNHITTNHPSFDINKIYVECPFTQNLENEYPPAQYGSYDNSYDYSPYQVAHFRQWVANKNASNGGIWDGINRTPTNDNIPEYIGGIEPERINWRLFIANMYFIINQKISQTIKSVDNRFKYELNSGFFSDNVFNWRRSDFALTGEMNDFVDMYKHNPARYYHQAISNKLVSGIREDQQSTIEWTRADGVIEEPAFTIEICDKIRKTIKDGVRQISLSFYEGNEGQAPLTTLYNPSNINDQSTVFGILHGDNTLYSNYVRLESPIIINKSIDTQYLSGGGFVDDNNLKLALSAAIVVNGSEKVKLKINWGLGNYKYLNLYNNANINVVEKVEMEGLKISNNNGFISDISNYFIPNEYQPFYFVNEFFIGTEMNNYDLTSLIGFPTMLRKLVVKKSVFPFYQDLLTKGYLANIPDNNQNILSNSLTFFIV